MSSVMRFDEWQDSNGVPVLNGAGGGLALGKILQVVQTVKKNTYSVSLAAGAMDTQNVPDLDVTITPSSVSSKILITHGLSENENVGHVQLFRNGSLVTDSIGDAYGSRTRSTSMGSSSFTFLDSPATTSPVTYGIRIGSRSSSTVTVYLNIFNGVNASRISSTSTIITAMEVAG